MEPDSFLYGPRNQRPFVNLKTRFLDISGNLMKLINITHKKQVRNPSVYYFPTDLKVSDVDEVSQPCVVTPILYS